MSAHNEHHPSGEDGTNAGGRALRRVRRVRIEEHQERVLEHLRGSLGYGRTSILAPTTGRLSS
jgi:hypothetical protein